MVGDKMSAKEIKGKQKRGQATFPVSLVCRR